jgi:low affinity Fe/Cu permease
MAASQPQSLTNHTKWDPLFHFILVPISVINLIVVSVYLYKTPSRLTAWVLVLAIAAILTLFKMRLYSLKVQNRLICLEEKFRMQSVLPESQRSYISQLTPTQFVGLRFASDEELTTLVERAAKEKLSRGDIKKAVVKWRADEYRV